MQTEIQHWLSDEELQNVYSSAYWNTEEIEKNKDWYILNGDKKKLLTYIRVKTTLHKEFEGIISFAQSMGLEIRGACVYLAAGVCWTSALLSRIEAVSKVYALEISKHRLLSIAPHVLDLLKSYNEKIVRVIGSFYDIKLPDQSVDFCFIASSLHHADRPAKLLLEVRRILRPNGFILIIGENPVLRHELFNKYIKNYIKIIFPFWKYKSGAIYKLFPKFSDLYPPDQESGDHYYRIKDYFGLFKESGFQLHQHKDLGFVTFLGIKEL